MSDDTTQLFDCEIDAITSTTNGLKPYAILVKGQAVKYAAAMSPVAAQKDYFSSLGGTVSLISVHRQRQVLLDEMLKQD